LTTAERTSPKQALKVDQAKYMPKKNVFYIKKLDPADLFFNIQL